MGASGEIPRGRLARSFVKTALRLGPRSGHEPELPPGIDTLATLLRNRGYHVAMKGKWHLSKPVDGEHWGPADPERVERDYGFAEWEPPDAGGDTKAYNFGGGNAGRTHEGWDEDYTRQMESWLSSRDLPEPFCLVFSLVNPHDVLGYPGSYRARRLRRRGVPRPRRAAAAHDRRGPAREAGRAGALAAGDGQLPRARSRTGRPSRTTSTSTPTCTGVVDRQIGRLLRALGSPEDEGSLRSRTIVIRTSDHGEMGLSHGGLRQKIFNAYEETIRVPLLISNPRLFPQPRQSDALVSLLDVVPTCLGIAGPGNRPQSLDGEDLAPLVYDRAPAVRDAVLFTYDDHQAGTALQNASGSPTASAACATSASSTPSTSTPTARSSPNTSSTTSRRTRSRRATCWESAAGAPHEPRHEELRERMAALLERLCTRQRDAVAAPARLSAAP